MVTKLASVIVPAYNEEDGIGACLESLLGIDYPNVEIIVVDDKSSDKTAEIASRYPVRVVRRTSRGERCIARNDGIKLARGEFIAFVDADCTVKEDWLSVLISDFADETIGAVGGIILTQGQGYFASYRNYSARENYGDSSKPIEVLDLPGGNCCYRAEVLRQLGGFDPNFGRHETYELGVRLRRNGYKLIGDPRSVVWHGHEGNLRKWFGAEYGTGYTAISLLRLKYLGSADLLAAQLRQVAFIGFLAVMVAGLIGFVPLSIVALIALAAAILELVRAIYGVLEVTFHYRDPKYLAMLPLVLMLRASLYVGYFAGLLITTVSSITYLTRTPSKRR